MRSSLLILALGIAIVLLFLYAWNLRGKLQLTKSILTEKEAQLSYFTAKSGKTVSEKPAGEVTKADLQKHYADLTADLKDMKVKLSGLQAVFKAAIEAKGEGAVTIVHDTVRVPGSVPVVLDSVFIADGWLRLRGGIKDQRFGYKYVYQDSIVMAISGKKRWFLGKERLYGSVRLSNPAARATNQTALLMNHRDKRFYIGVGANYDPFSNRFSPGIHAGWALVKF